MARVDNNSTYVRQGDLFESYKVFCTKRNQTWCKRSQLFDRLLELQFCTSNLDGYIIYRNMKLIETKTADMLICDEDKELAEEMAKSKKYKDMYDQSKKDLDILINKNELLEKEINLLKENQISSLKNIDTDVKKLNKK